MAEQSSIIAQPQDAVCQLIQVVTEKHETEKAQQTERHELEMRGLKEEMESRQRKITEEAEHQERINQLELEEKELRLRALKDMLQTERRDHVLELERKDEEMVATEEHHQKMLRQFQDSYEEELDMKEEDCRLMKEALKKKDQQIEELRKTMVEMMLEGRVLVGLAKKSVWKKLADQLSGQEEKQRSARSFKYFTEMNRK